MRRVVPSSTVIGKWTIPTPSTSGASDNPCKEGVEEEDSQETKSVANGETEIEAPESKKEFKRRIVSVEGLKTKKR